MADRSGGRLISENPTVRSKVGTVEVKTAYIPPPGPLNRGSSTPDTRL